MEEGKCHLQKGRHIHKIKNSQNLSELFRYEGQWMKGFKHGNGQFYTKGGYLGYDGEWEWGKILYIESNKYLKRNMIWHHSRMRNNKMNNFNIANINTRATQLNPNHLEK